MCRLFGLIAPRPVKITFPLLDAAESLRRQSLSNPDGWGVGYYAGGHAVVRKQPEAAHGSPGFSRVAEHARSHLFVAHVRLRTAGGVNLANTHPFSTGGWILAQNGGIGGAWHKRIKAEIGWGRIAGKTSGEHLLYWLHARAGHLRGAARDAAIVAAVRELIADPASIGSANFVLATGDQLYAFRFSPPQGNPRSLFYLRRVPPPAEAMRGVDESLGGIPRTPAVLVASEQVTGPDEPWLPVANGCLLIARRDLSLNLERIAAA